MSLYFNRWYIIIAEFPYFEYLCLVLSDNGQLCRKAGSWRRQVDNVNVPLFFSSGHTVILGHETDERHAKTHVTDSRQNKKKKKHLTGQYEVTF